MQNNMFKKIKENGFTLVELLVVMAIIMVLVSIGIVSFRSSQLRGRDGARKSNIKQIANALELFYSDYGKYPASVGGQLQGCPYSPASGTGTSCTWGSGSFTDNKTVYFKTLPGDPGSFTYYYRVVDPPLNQKFQIFGYLENTQDPECLAGTCTTPPVTYTCGGGKICNFAITSPNTSPTD